jgi:hypothetical protein
MTRAKRASCIPSVMPTTAIRINKIITDTSGDKPAHMPVFPSKRATRITAMQKPRMTTEVMAWAQKKRFYAKAPSTRLACRQMCLDCGEVKEQWIYALVLVKVCS